MAPKTTQRRKREADVQYYFDEAGFNVRYSDQNTSVVPSRLTQEAKKFTNPITKYVNNVEDLDEQTLYSLCEQFHTEKEIDDLLNLIKKDQEAELGELTDYYLNTGDEKDASQRVADGLKEEIKNIKEEYDSIDAQRKEISFKNNGWENDFPEIQRTFSTFLFGENNVFKFDESIFDGYKDEVAFVNKWSEKEKKESKLLQKTKMATNMRKCAECTGPLIDLYRAGKKFCNINIKDPTLFGEPYENANEVLTEFSTAVKSFLHAVNGGAENAGIKKDDKGESIDVENITGLIGQFSAMYEQLGEDLEIEKKKEKDSGFLGFSTEKKLEHQQNIKYIEQNRKACQHINNFLRKIPNYVYATTKDGELIAGTKRMTYFYDPIALQQELEGDCKKYMGLKSKCFGLNKDLEEKEADLLRCEEFNLKPDTEKTKTAFDAMNGMYKDMVDFQKKASVFKKKIVDKKAALEAARKAKEEAERRKAEEEKKRKEEEAKKKKEEKERLKKEEEERKKQEEEKKKQEAEAKKAALKELDAKGDNIDANIYRKELLRLTKELTSKTYRMGQNNSQGFLHLKSALSDLLDPKANYNTEDIVSRKAFIDQMKEVEEACTEYSENHKEGKLNDNQMTRLKLMSRIKNVINMAKEGIDPMSYEGRRRMLIEKYNNAQYIDTLKNSKASAEDKELAKANLLNYDSISAKGNFAAQGDKMQDYLYQFHIVKHSMEDIKLEDQLKEEKAELMLRELKKPGAKLLKEINNPKKVSEKTL